MQGHYSFNIRTHKVIFSHYFRLCVNRNIFSQICELGFLDFTFQFGKLYYNHARSRAYDVSPDWHSDLSQRLRTYRNPCIISLTQEACSIVTLQAQQPADSTNLPTIITCHSANLKHPTSRVASKQASLTCTQRRSSMHAPGPLTSRSAQASPSSVRSASECALEWGQHPPEPNTPTEARISHDTCTLWSGQHEGSHLPSTSLTVP